MNGNSCGSLLFMHTGIQMKYVSKLTDARRASRGEGHAPARLYTGIQMKYVSKLTDARRASRGEGHSPARLYMFVIP